MSGRPEARPLGAPVQLLPRAQARGPALYPTPLTARVHSCPRAGPVALARVPVSFRPGYPRPAHKNLTPTPKFGLQRQMWGGNQSPLPSVAGMGVGMGGGVRVYANLRLLKGLGTWVGGRGRGGKGSYVRMVALELKIAECREKVINVSAVLPAHISSAQGWAAPSRGPLCTPYSPVPVVFVTSKLEPGTGPSSPLSGSFTTFEPQAPHSHAFQEIRLNRGHFCQCMHAPLAVL